MIILAIYFLERYLKGRIGIYHSYLLKGKDKMMQIPNLPNYVQVPQQQPVYNAVKIDINNPTVNAPSPQPVQAQQNPQLVPMYNYPQAPVYSYPQAQTQPYYMPPQIVTPEVQTAPTIVEAPKTAEVLPPPPVVTEEVKPEDAEKKTVSETTTEAPKTETVSSETPVEIVPPTPVTPQVDLNAFISKLTNPDFEIQAAGMEEIANMVNEDPQKATELLDTKIVDALTNIVTADTSKLAGPTEAQVAARQKLAAGEQMSDEEKQTASQISQYEQAERNKSYAMFTAAILQKLYGEEVQKLTNSTVPLTELPGAVTIVEQLKNNENPMVRTSAIEALSYIQAPAYKKDLETIFTIAQKDSDAGVKEAATLALDKLSKITEEVKLNPQTPQQETEKAEEVKAAA